MRGQQKITVLIADDHPMVREGLRSMLREEGIRVVDEAKNGREAVRKAKALSPQILLLDIRMPDMDGLAALRAIKEEQPAVSVIMITIYENPGYLLKAVAAGAAGYLLKGISRDELVEVIHRIADGESLIDRKLLREVIENLIQERGKTTAIDEEALERIEALTIREREVLRLIVEGLSTREIAEVLDVGEGTVKTHVHHIITKLHVSDRTQAAVWAVQNGLV
ncbi:MAG: response regulator [Candidatus Bipolaricaulia bacterium]